MRSLEVLQQIAAVYLLLEDFCQANELPSLDKNLSEKF